MLKILFQLLRVRQYNKNLFVLAALLFTKGYARPDLTFLALKSFAVMCLLGSATYIANDVIDRHRDQAHPRKRHRPIASGAVVPRTAVGLAFLLLMAGIGVATTMRTPVVWCGLSYIALQVSYNAGLKATPIADVFVIATGFVVRVVIGAVAIDAQVSGWILLCTGSLALLLGFGKRRAELVAMGTRGNETRPSLAAYTLPALDALVVLSASCSAVFYGLYGIASVTAQRNPGLFVTVPVVAYGICRYLYLVFSKVDTSEPESLVLSDAGLIFALVVFFLSAIAALNGLNLTFLSSHD